MNNIIKPNGEYLTSFFNGIQGRYKLTGIKSNPDNKKWGAMDSIDTFKNIDTGEFKDILRSDLFNKAELGEVSV